MSNLRQRFNRFCFRNRDKGIPNLMLYIVLGNALVIIMSMANGGAVLNDLLCFDKGKILQGQVWRLVTYAFTQSDVSFISLLFLYFFYMLGRQVEQSMGTLKFNLFYFSGIILMDVFAMIFSPIIPPDGMVTMDEYVIHMSAYRQMSYFLHLTLILTFATLYPDSQFLILFVIPIKAWIMAVIYLVLTLISVYNLTFPTMYFPHNLFPLVVLANYFIFVGSDIKNLLPPSLRFRASVKTRKPEKKTGTIPFSPSGHSTTKNYNHRCTVCGRTDVDFPDLEFRYCSRCNGYHCYCEDHINNHTHVE